MSSHTNHTESKPSDTPSDGPPMKRLIICCDGTWQASNHGLQTIPSNIAKISRAIAFHDKKSPGKSIQQIVYYSAGVGTGTNTSKDLGFIQDQISWLVSKWEGGVGAGLDENICEAYNFIVNNYWPGDELYFFGFSRGAYTARATAGLVANVGICTNPMLDSFYKMYSAYRLKDHGQLLKDTTWAKSEDGLAWFEKTNSRVIIKVVGVFDTVGSLGYPDTGHINVEKFNKRFGFHDTNLHPNIEYGFHALALDEHRRPFTPTLWSLPPAVGGERQTKKLVQCWFPGMHVNIGGGNSDQLDEKKKHLTDMEAMANITYAWMIDRVREYTDLAFDERLINDIVSRYRDAQHAVTSADEGKTYRGWGLGPVADSSEGLEIAGSTVRTPGHYADKNVTHEYIHPVVAYAKRPGASSQYNAPALHGFTRKKRTNINTSGYEWVKVYDEAAKEKGWHFPDLSYFRGGSVKPKGEQREVRVPEFVIPGNDGTIEYTERWLMKTSSDGLEQSSAKLSTTEAKIHAARQKVFEETKKFIEQLDQDNGVFSQGGFA